MAANLHSGTNNLNYFSISFGVCANNAKKVCPQKTLYLKDLLHTSMTCAFILKNILLFRYPLNMRLSQQWPKNPGMRSI